VADAFDAMTSDRPYRKAMAPPDALAEILRNSGSQFDPEAVSAFLGVYQKHFAPHRRPVKHSGISTDELP
jgi:HD-GYP domain-containing protein (c-di-GMP phosphodiesterase class II)